MLVNIEENPMNPNEWIMRTTDGMTASYLLMNGIKPVEAITDNKKRLKDIIKLKREGFTAEEIIEISNEGVLDG